MDPIATWDVVFNGTHMYVRQYPGMTFGAVIDQAAADFTREFGGTALVDVQQITMRVM